MGSKPISPIPPPSGPDPSEPFGPPKNPPSQPADKSAEPQKETMMNVALQHVITNWKTTVSSILTALIGAGAYFAAVPTAVLQQNGITQKEIFWGTVIVGLAKIALGAIQTDAKPSQPPPTA